MHRFTHRSSYLSDYHSTSAYFRNGLLGFRNPSGFVLSVYPSHPLAS